MLNPTTLGNFTLNLACVLYLFVYIPQIRYNNTKHHLAELSVSLHMILMTSFVLDLMYGYLQSLPWQYLLVSWVALSTLSIQHIQIVRLSQQNRYILLYYMLNIFYLSLLLILVGFFCFKNILYSNHIIGLMGGVSRVGFLSYTLPQIIQNHRFHSAKALDTTFLTLSLLLALLDLTSAWCLDWGWPNKLGEPFSMLFILVLLWQKKSNVFNKQLI